MILPIVLIVLAALAGAVVAYGTDAGWGSMNHGVALIVWSRRLQWPLVTVSLVLCVALIALVIAGKRRAWWLVGLGPILALFAHRFAGERGRAYLVADEPTWISTAAASTNVAALPGDDDWVVGLTFNDVAYAYPYAALFRSPVVVQSDREKRMVLLWSAYANRVVAFQATGTLKARDLEVVSTPANALLVYNARVGQFINGITGQTIDRAPPADFQAAIPTAKTTWRLWRQAHPGTKVLPLPQVAAEARYRPPTQAILPVFRLPGDPPGPSGAGSMPAGQRGIRATVIGTTRPAAAPSDEIPATPLNLFVDGAPALVVRPGAQGAPVAFDARGAGTASPHFVAVGRKDPKHPDAALREAETGTLWTADGAPIAQNSPAGRRVKRLGRLPVDEGVDWDVLHYWCPDLELIHPEPEPIRLEPESPASSEQGGTSKRRVHGRSAR